MKLQGGRARKEHDECGPRIIGEPKGRRETRKGTWSVRPKGRIVAFPIWHNLEVEGQGGSWATPKREAGVKKTAT